MARDSIQQFSTTAASNTDVTGISTAPGWSPGNVGPAFRALMSLLASYSIPLSVAISGTTTTLTAAQASCDLLTFTGTLGAANTVTIPAQPSFGWAANGTTGGYNVVLTTGSGTTATLPPGGAAYFWTCDGTNVAIVSLASSSVSLTGNLTVGGNATVSGTLGVTGQASVGTLAVGGITVPAVLRGYLGGLGLSNDGVSPNTVLDIATGTVADEIAEAGYITVASPTTINCATTGAGGLDTGSLAANTSYAAFVIGKTDGTSAGYASTSLTPTLPAGYTLRRRIGLFKTDASAHILPFVQNGNYFWYSPPIAGAGTTIGTTAGLIAAGVPSGIAVTAIVGVQAENSSAGIAVLISSPSVTDIAPNVPGPMTFFANANQWASGQVAVLTDASGNFRARSTQNSTAFDWTCLGWFDPLGQS